MIPLLYLIVSGVSTALLPAVGAYENGRLEKARKEGTNEYLPQTGTLSWWHKDFFSGDYERYGFSSWPMPVVYFFLVWMWPLTLAGYGAYKLRLHKLPGLFIRGLSLPGLILAQHNLKMLKARDEFVLEGEEEVERMLLEAPKEKEPMPKSGNGWSEG